MSRTLSVAEALREALGEEMRRDPSVIAYGEDFRLGYVWPVSRGLLDEFGPERIRDVPICERLQIGMTVGASLTGLRPVVELQFSDFLMIGMDGLVNQAAKMSYMSGGQARPAMVVRLPYGYVRNYAAQHSQTTYGMLTGIPGLVICAPTQPDDAKGLLKSAIRSDAPVAFFEHKRLYPVKGTVEDKTAPIKFGSARVYDAGTDATVIAIGLMVHEALKAQTELSSEGIGITVIDPRTLVPLDLTTILERAARSRRVVLVEEAPRQGGYIGSIVADIVESGIELERPPVRISAPNVPVPYSWPLEDATIPTSNDVVAAVKDLESS